MKKQTLAALIAIVILLALTVCAPDLLEERTDYYNQLVAEKLFGEGGDSGDYDGYDEPDENDDSDYIGDTEPAEDGGFAAPEITENPPEPTDLPAPVLTLVPTAEPTASPEPKPIIELPMDDFSAGLIPITDNYYQELRSAFSGDAVMYSVYKDDSIYVEVHTEDISGATFHIARVKIAHPSQLRTAVASKIGSSSKMGTTDMATKMNAVVAINGDYYTYRKAAAFIVRQGEVLQQKPGTLDQLVIDYDGNFHIITAEDKTQALSELSGNIYQAFSFGPALVVDGAVTEKRPYSFDASGVSNQRTAIGQIGELEYLLVVVDGRMDTSAGITCWDLAKVMADMGCINAYNLDGGGSATMTWRGERVNTREHSGDRSISDSICFVTSTGWTQEDIKNMLLGLGK